jgi:hypothetical protein
MTTPNLDKIASKIAKLLSLAEGNGNAAESEAAWAKAQALATEYQLDLEALRQTGEAPAADMVKETLRKPSGSWKFVILAALCKANACKAITSQNYLYILGEKNDVRVIVGLYERIIKQIRRLSAAETKAWGERSHGAWENSYRVGMALRVQERINEAFACAVPAGSTALVLARDSRVAEFAVSLYGDLKTRTMNVKTGGGADWLGYAHGDRVQFTDALEAK